MIIRTVAAIAALFAACGLARAQDEVPTLGVYVASCGPVFECTVLLESMPGHDHPVLTIRGVRTDAGRRIVCDVDAPTRPGTGVTTVGDEEIGGLVATVESVPVVVTGLDDGNSILVSASAEICPVRGMPNGGRHLAVAGIYHREVD